MKKLKNILTNLKLPEEKENRLYSFFEDRYKANQFIYPQEVSNNYGINDVLVSRLFVALVIQDFLQVYTVPYDRSTNTIVIKNALEGIVLNFDDSTEILDPDSLEPYDNSSLEAVAAYRIVTL